MEKSIGARLTAASEERETCGKIAEEVINLFEKGKKDLDGDAYRELRNKWSKNNCDNLEGFPPFSKIPKA